MQISSHAQHMEPVGGNHEQIVNDAIAAHHDKLGNLLPILHDVQDHIGYIPPAVVPQLANALNLSRAEIHGVISFYAHFRQAPAGEHVLEVCMAEACQSMRGNELAEHARNRLSCDFNETSGDGKVSLAPVYCLGLCAQSPAVMLDGKPHARMTPARLDALLDAQGGTK